MARNNKPAKPAVELGTFISDEKELADLTEKLDFIAQLKDEKNDIETKLRDELVPEVAAILSSYGQEKVLLNGFTHSVFNGTNVTYSGDRIKKALMHYGIDPDIQVKILAESRQDTPYTTIVTKEFKPETEQGGLTGAQG